MESRTQRVNAAPPLCATRQEPSAAHSHKSDPPFSLHGPDDNVPYYVKDPQSSALLTKLDQIHRSFVEFQTHAESALLDMESSVESTTARSQLSQSRNPHPELDGTQERTVDLLKETLRSLEMALPQGAYGTSADVESDETDTEPFEDETKPVEKPQRSVKKLSQAKLTSAASSFRGIASRRSSGTLGLREPTVFDIEDALVQLNNIFDLTKQQHVPSILRKPGFSIPTIFQAIRTSSREASVALFNAVAIYEQQEKRIAQLQHQIARISSKASMCSQSPKRQTDPLVDHSSGTNLLSQKPDATADDYEFLVLLAFDRPRSLSIDLTPTELSYTLGLVERMVRVTVERSEGTLVSTSDDRVIYVVSFRDAVTALAWARSVQTYTMHLPWSHRMLQLPYACEIEHNPAALDQKYPEISPVGETPDMLRIKGTVAEVMKAFTTFVQQEAVVVNVAPGRDHPMAQRLGALATRTPTGRDVQLSEEQQCFLDDAIKAFASCGKPKKGEKESPRRKSAKVSKNDRDVLRAPWELIAEMMLQEEQESRDIVGMGRSLDKQFVFRGPRFRTAIHFGCAVECARDNRFSPNSILSLLSSLADVAIAGQTVISQAAIDGAGPKIFLMMRGLLRAQDSTITRDKFKGTRVLQSLGSQVFYELHWEALMQRDPLINAALFDDPHREFDAAWWIGPALHLISWDRCNGCLITDVSSRSTQTVAGEHHTSRPPQEHSPEGTRSASIHAAELPREASLRPRPSTRGSTIGIAVEAAESPSVVALPSWPPGASHTQQRPSVHARSASGFLETTGTLRVSHSTLDLETKPKKRASIRHAQRKHDKANRADDSAQTEARLEMDGITKLMLSSHEWLTEWLSGSCDENDVLGFLYSMFRTDAEKLEQQREDSQASILHWEDLISNADTIIRYSSTVHESAAVAKAILCHHFVCVRDVLQELKLERRGRPFARHKVPVKPRTGDAPLTTEARNIPSHNGGETDSDDSVIGNTASASSSARTLFS
jgi:hypothetical protein